MQGFFAQPVSSSVLGRPGEKDLLGRLKGMERKVTPCVTLCFKSACDRSMVHQPVSRTIYDTLSFSLEYMQVTCPYFVCFMS